MDNIRVLILTPPDWYTPDQVRDYYQDLVFIVILVIIVALEIVLFIKSLMNAENRNIHNFIMSSCLVFSLLTRMVCMIYSVTVDANQLVYANTIKFYFYYQLPFDTLNLSVTAQFF